MFNRLNQAFQDIWTIDRKAEQYISLYQQFVEKVKETYQDPNKSIGTEFRGKKVTLLDDWLKNEEKPCYFCSQTNQKNILFPIQGHNHSGICKSCFLKSEFGDMRKDPNYMYITSYLSFESKDQLFSWLSKLATSSHISKCKYNGVTKDTNTKMNGHNLHFIFDEETYLEGLHKLNRALEGKYQAMHYIWVLSFDSIFIPLQNIYEKIDSEDFTYFCNKINKYAR